MSGKAAVGAVNVQRKTWDKEKFAEKAKERASGFVVEEEKAGPAPYRAAPAGLAGPAGSERAYLPSREVDLKLDEKLGKKRVSRGGSCGADAPADNLALAHCSS